MALCPTLFVETGRAEAQVPRGLGHRPSPSGMGSGSSTQKRSAPQGAAAGV